MKRFEGAGISPGIAIAPIHKVVRERVEHEARAISESDIDAEFQRFLASVAATRAELLALREKTASEIGEKEAEIFDAHIMVLDDPLLHYEVSKRLKSDLQNIEAVLESVIEGLKESFAGMQDSVMRERSADIADVGEKLIRNLLGRESEELKVAEPSVIIAVDISPSVAATLNTDFVLGLVLEIGSTTSHAAILARALGIPAVVVKADAMIDLHNCSHVIVDGIDGVVICNPDDATLRKYRDKSNVLLRRALNLRKRTTLDAITSDGTRVNVAANLEIPAEIAVAREHGAYGIGLYRTEYLFMNRRVLPDEEEQYQHYRVVAEAFGDKPVVIRTIDIGGDKFLSDTDIPQSMNAYLGLRAIRLSLQQPDLFKAQLRAIVRASRHGNIRLMFPMIACIEEVSAAMGTFAECAEELSVDPNSISVGIMIETPSAALTSPTLARYLDFFSIGTNDLIQYTMAAERGNEDLEYLHRPTHPAVIRLINEVVIAAKKNEIGLSVCGEMAADFRMIPILLGLGVTDLSTNPRSIPGVKEMIRRVSIAECRSLIHEISDCAYSSDIARIIENRFSRRIEDLTG